MKLTHVLEAEQAEDKVVLGRKWIAGHPEATFSDFRQYALSIGFTRTTAEMFFTSQKTELKRKKVGEALDLGDLRAAVGHKDDKDDKELSDEQKEKIKKFTSKKEEDDKKRSDLKEHDGETLATTLERGKNKLNSWYAGFYDGFHGHNESDADDSQYKRGYRKGKSTASQKMYG